MQGSFNLDNEDSCSPHSQVPSVVIHELLKIGYRIQVMLLLALLFTCCVDVSHVYAASQLIVALSCMPSSSATPNPASTPSPSLTASPDTKQVEKSIFDYITLVLGGDCQDAYSLLSVDVLAQEPYSVFIHDMEFTLRPGCWMIGQASISQIDRLTWDISVAMTQVSCDTNNPMVYYSWHFHMQMQDGQLVITSIGLYPTAPGN